MVVVGFCRGSYDRRPPHIQEDDQKEDPTEKYSGGPHREGPRRSRTELGIQKFVYLMYYGLRLHRSRHGEYGPDVLWLRLPGEGGGSCSLCCVECTFIFEVSCCDESETADLVLVLILWTVYNKTSKSSVEFPGGSRS